MEAHDRRLAVVLLVPFLAAIAFSWARLIGELDDVPADADYVAARQILEREGFVPGQDALVLLPPWSLRPLVVLGGLEPISGDDIARQPLDRYRRLWAVVEPDAEPYHEPLVARLGAPARSVLAGRVRVERFDLPGAVVTFDFARRLEDASVVLAGGQTAAACPRQASGGFTCGRESWQRVTREWLLVSENADRAVWSHPPARGQRLEIVWPDVLLGERIVVRAGFTRDGADRARAPVRLRVIVDGVEVAVLQRTPAFRFDVDVIDIAPLAGRRSEVRFAVESDDNQAAHFAWDAWTARGPP